MINPVHLHTFLALCETRHFTKTAEKLNMTQPGVSQHLKALERELGVLLLFRQGKIIELTQEGEQLRRFGLEQRAAEVRMREKLHEDEPHSGELKISCSGSMAMNLYPDLLELQREFRALQVSLEAAPNARSVKLVKENEFDIGLITHRIDDPELSTRELGTERLCVTVPKGYPCNWADLMRLGFINHPNGEHYAAKVFELNWPDQFGRFNDISQKGYINQLNQILLPVAKGLGFTVLPETTIDAYPDQSAIDKGLLAKPCFETIYMITKKYKALPRRYERVIQILERRWAQPKHIRD